MANILVLYHSNTGNTAEMAKHVERGVQIDDLIKTRLLSVEQAGAEDILWADGVAAGSPTNLGAVSWKFKKFFDDLSQELWGKIDGKFACAFSSSGTWGGGTELVCQQINNILMNYGFLTFGVTDWVHQRMSPHYGSISAGKPEQGAQESCLRLGRRLAEWVLVYKEQKTEFHPLKAQYPRPFPAR